MDNPAAPIPSTSPQPAVSSLPAEVLAKAGPAESQSRRWFLWLPGGLVMLIIGIALGVFGVKLLNQSQGQSQLTSTPTASPSPQSPTLTPAPDPTADWKTYKNDRYNFEIRYPHDLDLIENTAGHNNSVAEIDLRRVDPYFEFILQLTPMAHKDLVSLTIGTSGNKEESITIGGIKGTKLVAGGGIGGSVKQTVAYFIKNNLTYYFFTGSNPELTDQILSTFKFTD